MKSYFSLFFKGSILSVVTLGIIGVLNYSVRRYLVFNLSTYDYGLFYSILALVSLAGSFAEFGLTQAGTVLIAEASLSPDNKKSLSSCFSCMFSFKLITSLFLFFLLLVFNVPIRYYYLKGVPLSLYVIGVSILLSQVTDTVFKSLWNGTKNYMIQNFLSVLQISLLCLLTVFLTKWFQVKGTALAFFIYPLVGGGVALLLAWKKIGIRLVVPDSKVFKRLFHLSGFVAIGTTLLNMTYQLNTVLLTSLNGVNASADYNIALPIMQIIQTSMVFPYIFLPLAVQMVKKNDYRVILRYRFWATVMTTILVPLFFVLFYYLSPFLVRFLFAERYIFVAPTVTILCSGQLLYTYGSFLMQIVIALNEVRSMAVFAVTTFFLNLILGIFLIPSFGIAGAASATFLAYLFFAVTMNSLLSRLLRKRLQQPVL